MQELLHKRGRHAKHYDVGGLQRQAVFGRNLHYWRNGWQDVELGWRPTAWPTSDRAEYLAIVTPTGFLLWDRATKRGIRWQVTGLTTFGRKATFADQGLMWDYTLRRSGVKLSATVAATRGPQTYSWNYQLLGGAAAFSVRADGALVSDAFVVAPPVAIGADGVVYPCGQWSLTPTSVSFTFDDTTMPAEAYPYELDPSSTFSVAAGTDDGEVDKQDSSYPPGGSANVNTGGGTIGVSRTFLSGSYTVRVALARWDTSSLPDTATIDDADFRGIFSAVYSADGRNLTAEWYEHNGIDSGDYTATSANGAGSWAIGGLTGGNVANTLQLSNFAANVNKTGYTGLRFHCDGGSPSGLNVVTIRSYDDATYDEPQLIVTYTETSVNKSSSLSAGIDATLTATVSATTTVTMPLERITDHGARALDRLAEQFR